MTVSVLVPSSLVREAEDKREATRKIGYVARAATVFRADRLVVFPDPDGERHWGGGFVSTVLEYAATPPYLRKEVFGKRDELEYAGVLPPLRAPSLTGSESEGSGSLRQGIVTEVGPEGRVRVNCGLQHPISLVTPSEMTVGEGERVTVRISSRSPVRAKLVDPPPSGWSVTRTDLPAALDRDDAGVRIATSRHGVEVTTRRLTDVVGRVERDGMTVAFGSPGRGLPEILDLPTDSLADGRPGDDGEDEADAESGVEHGAPSRFDLWLNAVPNQGSEVVRTEEAMFAALACLNLKEK
ncbi:RNA methyltransferase [Halorussus gelatinilyticus]|uniref:RNA methyltransferase n=1 Tax=Halorussus gelatinilyticus TaxID=2937524 RepID=A0A8U0IK23_9EURY|nr:RNA methyltransferase [Halorussus gelatinilyticus]UPW01025.1 RNA methyltransferase [Halorussus gelatinilyticus]